MYIIKTFTIIFVLLCVCACSSIRKYISPDEENLMSGAGSIMIKKNDVKSSANSESFELIDIDKLLKTYGLNSPQDVSKNQSISADEYKYRRNDLQDRLIAASNQRCGAYLRTLTSSKSQTQMGWGGLATLLSGAASVTTPASTAKVLAAGSTVSNAFLSLYNESYFSNLTLTVISAGISKQRKEVLDNITAHRNEDLTKYPVNRAIADALTYHSACNVISGLEAAALATKSATPSN